MGKGLSKLFQKMVRNEVPGGKGRFGYDATNPIPVAGIQGEYRYLTDLRTADGGRVQYRHDGSHRAANSTHSLDRYMVMDATGLPLCRLYFDMFHTGNSEKTPQGFHLDESSF